MDGVTALGNGDGALGCSYGGFFYMNNEKSGVICLDFGLSLKVFPFLVVITLHIFLILAYLRHKLGNKLCNEIPTKY